MKILSPFLSDARGSIGGDTFARNPTGMYVRARTAPTQPRTASQVANRSNFTTAAQAWNGLSAATRLAWNAYADTTTKKDSLGQSYTPAGFQTFVSCMRNLQTLGLTAVPELPNPNFAAPPVDFPGVAWSATGGALYYAKAVVLPDWSVYYGSCALQVSQPRPASSPFTARANFRNVPLTETPIGAVLDILAESQLLFPVVVAGQIMKPRLRYVDNTTGQAGPWNYGPDIDVEP